MRQEYGLLNENRVIPNKNNPVVHQSVPHDSAHKHVSGEAIYGDDIPEPRGLQHAYMFLSPKAHAKITKLDLSAVEADPNVTAVVSAKDLTPETNDIGPTLPGDLAFADGKVEYHGQPIFAVSAPTRELARKAAQKAVIEYEDLPTILTIQEALDAGAQVGPTKEWEKGDAAAALAAAPHTITGEIEMGGQEQFYLEGQNGMAIPQEDGDMFIHSSTQGVMHVQQVVSKMLGIPYNAVTVENRRMGGGFGGKETQGGHYVGVAALLAQKTGKPTKIRLDRDDDMIVSGKRHGFLIKYKIGFDDDGRILAADILQAVNGGYAPDLTGPVADRGIYHMENAYFIKDIKISSHRCKTHTVSNTAFRGFGGPQGIVGAEEYIEQIARYLHKDPWEIRQLNLYGKEDRNQTPYGMTITDNILPELFEAIDKKVDYKARRKAIEQWNKENEYLKKGIAVVPVKFGISFTKRFQNQGGALILVYLDGTVQLNHGGTEMGQGLHTKVAQVAAEVLGLDLDKVRLTPTTTGKVPNTSPTSASTGADLNGAAAFNAASKIVNRLTDVVREHYELSEDTEVQFKDNAVFAEGKRLASFQEVVNLGYFARVPLSATGYYATPTIDVDELGRGRPFYYFAYGIACSEVVVDTLTGEYKMTKVDVIHDVGKSLNPAIDLGQVEGGFIQGVGWLTAEELVWDPKGRLATHAPSTYKIPAIGDLPSHFDVELYERGVNVEEAIFRSKAVGEPPLPLGISVLHAIKDAVSAVSDHQQVADLDAPATPERVLKAIDGLRDGDTTKTSTGEPVPAAAK